MIQRIWGRIRLFLLLCGIWGALFFTIANVNSDIWFFPTMDFYVLYRIGHLYVLFLLIRGFLRNGEFIRRSRKKVDEMKAIHVILMLYSCFIMCMLLEPIIDCHSRWWRTLETLSNLEVYFATYKEYSLSVDQTDFVSFVFVLICFIICCMPSKKLSSIIQLNTPEVIEFLWPYEKKDIDDIPEFQKNTNIKIIEGNAFVKVCWWVSAVCIVMIWSPFLLLNGSLKLMFGKGFMLKMVGDYEQAEMSEIKNARVRLFFERISLYVLLIFSILYITFVTNSIYVNIFNIYIKGVALLIGIFVAFAAIIWAGYDNHIETKKIHEQEILDLSKNNKNWMLLYAHRLINTGKTIFDNVSLLREKDEPELRINDLKTNTQHLLDDGEKCLNYAQALSRQPVIETIDLINICKKTLAEIEDDRRTAAFCVEDDILLEYSGDDTLCRVKTDENILQKILYELIANAVSYRIPKTAVIITIEKKESDIQMKIENALALKDAEKMQEYLNKIDAFWNWQNVSSAGDIRLGLVFTKGYAEMVDIGIKYDVNNKLTFSANLEIPIA